MGDRVCVDLCSLMRPGEGLLVCVLLSFACLHICTCTYLQAHRQASVYLDFICENIPIVYLQLGFSTQNKGELKRQLTKLLPTCFMSAQRNPYCHL